MTGGEEEIVVDLGLGDSLALRGGGGWRSRRRGRFVGRVSVGREGEGGVEEVFDFGLARDLLVFAVLICNDTAMRFAFSQRDRLESSQAKTKRERYQGVLSHQVESVRMKSADARSCGSFGRHGWPILLSDFVSLYRVVSVVQCQCCLLLLIFFIWVWLVPYLR